MLGSTLDGSTLSSVLDSLDSSKLGLLALDGSTLGSVLDGHGGLALGSRLAWLDTQLDTQRSWQLGARLLEA